MDASVYLFILMRVHNEYSDGVNRQASCVLALMAIGVGIGTGLAQTDEANGANVKFATLYTFCVQGGSPPNCPDGENPVGGFLQATNGDFYGVTITGGLGCAPYGCGTIFKMTPTGVLTVIHSFCIQSGCPDGDYPSSPVQATNGEIYGTTILGGLYGAGTVYKITPSGTLTTLYNFCGQASCSGGINPNSPLVQAANGGLYGIASGGGTSGFGTLFEITPKGSLTTLFDFCSQANCYYDQAPYTGLVQARNGKLYGMTTNGGSYGHGSIFEVTPAGAQAILYNFCPVSGCADGSTPEGELVQAPNGDLYGTTEQGGLNCSSSGGCGTIFRITPGGSMTTVYQFCSQPSCVDGETPVAGLVLAANGNFYGTTYSGGAYGGGTVFKISSTGTLTTLYSFCSQVNCSDGKGPNGLVQGTNGVFYGITGVGGGNGAGTIFSLSTGEVPFVEPRPTIGIVGEVVTIVGYGLEGVTSVTFNGTPATILYDAPTVIYAEVPTGATTGDVQVVTPNGTFTSNVAFEVVP